MREKINIKQFDKEIIEYFKLTKNITRENLLHKIVLKAGPIIENWVRFKYTMYLNNSEKSDEIINVIYSKLLDACFSFDPQRGIPFKSYFYKNIKLYILSEFGKILLKQQEFETKLTWFSQEAKSTIWNMYHYNYQNSIHEEFKNDFERFLNTLNEMELMYLKKKDIQDNFYSTTRVNLLMNSMKNKAQKFFN